MAPVVLVVAAILLPSFFDPNDLRRYAGEDAKLELKGVHPEVVFIGDSITGNWRQTAPSTWDASWINRGIGGQNSHAVRMRFAQDVLALHPKTVHILVGINDIGSPGAMLPLSETEANIDDMASRARAEGIRVIIGTVERVPDWAWTTKPLNPPGSIERLNAWIRVYAKKTKAVCADYWAVVVQGRKKDNIHLTAAGYELMSRVARQALART